MAFINKINYDETRYTIVCSDCFTEPEIRINDSDIVLSNKDNNYERLVDLA